VLVPDKNAFGFLYTSDTPPVSHISEQIINKITKQKKLFLKLTAGVCQ